MRGDRKLISTGCRTCKHFKHTGEKCPVVSCDCDKRRKETK